MQLWQFVGLIVVFSIALGTPLFLCLVYHHRQIHDVRRREVRRRSRPNSRVVSLDYPTNYPGLDPTTGNGRQNSGNFMPPPLYHTRGSHLHPSDPRNPSVTSTVPLLPLTPEQIHRSRDPSNYRGVHQSPHPSPQHHQQQQQYRSGTAGPPHQDHLNTNFPESQHHQSSYAYPGAAGIDNSQRAPNTSSVGPGSAYGTLGNIINNSYAAAARAYRHRSSLQFFSWMAPWFRPSNLSVIDEESTGSSRFSKTRFGRRGKTGTRGSTSTTSGGRRGQRQKGKGKGRDKKSSSKEHLHGQDGKKSKGDGSSSGTFGTITSGFSMRGALGSPPVLQGPAPNFDRISEQHDYNPGMVMSLTRRLLRLGFRDDGDGNGEEAAGDGKARATTTPVRTASGGWKGAAGLKKRALERRRAEVESGKRVVSYKRKATKGSFEMTRVDGDDEDEDYNDEEEGEEMMRSDGEEEKSGSQYSDDDDDEQQPVPIQGGLSIANAAAGMNTMARSSIRDFAHALYRNIVNVVSEDDLGEYDGDVSNAGTVRHHHIYDEADDESDDADEAEEEITPATTGESASGQVTTASASGGEAATGTSSSSDHNIDKGGSGNEDEGMATATATGADIGVGASAGTLRGRKSVRDKEGTPDTQRKRMARNTPKNASRRSLSGVVYADAALEQAEIEGDGDIDSDEVGETGEGFVKID